MIGGIILATSFYSPEELLSLGFYSVGKNVLISRYARIYNAQRMIIGNDVRIDDFCIISGKILMGNNIHIAAYSAIYGGDTGVELCDFSGLSSRCVIYAESDDYSGNYLTNPTVDSKFLGIITGKVKIGKHVIIGTGSTVLPGVTIGEGVAIGSMSLVNTSLNDWGIYAGIPCKYKKDRSKSLLDLERKFLEGK